LTGFTRASDGKVALYLRGDAPRLVPHPLKHLLTRSSPAQGTPHVARRQLLPDLYNARGGDEEVILDACGPRLVRRGDNDTFAPLRLLGPLARRPARGHGCALTQPRAAGGGRWWPISSVQGRRQPTLHSEAGVLLQR